MIRFRAQEHSHLQKLMREGQGVSKWVKDELQALKMWIIGRETCYARCLFKGNAGTLNKGQLRHDGSQGGD